MYLHLKLRLGITFNGLSYRIRHKISNKALHEGLHAKTNKQTCPRCHVLSRLPMLVLFYSSGKIATYP